MSLQLHRPDGRGGIERRAGRDEGWRKTTPLAALGRGRRGGQLPALKNPEMNPTSTVMSVLFWLGLAAATFVVIVGGYTVGLWKYSPLVAQLSGVRAVAATQGRD